VLALAGAFLLPGVIFVLAPPAPEGEGLACVRAIGFRVLTLARDIAALTIWSSRRAFAIVLGSRCSSRPRFGLAGATRAPSSPWHLALHAAVAVVFAGLAWWCFDKPRGRAVDALRDRRSAGP